MSAPKRKPAIKKPVPAKEVALPDVRTNLDEISEQPEEAENPTLDEISETMGSIFQPAAPEPTEEVRVLAQTVRAYRESRDVRFELASGVICMFGYSGLMRATINNNHQHIATVAEIEAMSDQQIYDAVMAAGARR